MKRHLQEHLIQHILHGLDKSAQKCVGVLFGKLTLLCHCGSQF